MSKITLDTVFYVNSISKSEDRSSKGKEVDSQSIYLVDNAMKDKNNEKNWTPITNACIYLIGMDDSGIQFGKKYKITLEEVK